MFLPRLALLLCLLSGLAAAADPVVTTGAATDVTDLTATFNGTVTPGAGNVVYNDFQFGSTPGVYPGSASARPVSSGGASTEVLAVTVDFLLPNTTYYYRTACWQPSTGVTYYGQVQTFTTGAPNTPPTFEVAGVQLKTTTAHVGANSIRARSSPATVSLEWGLTSAYGSSHTVPETFQLNQVGSGGHVITGLTPSTTYHYRIKAENAQGTTYSTDQTFRTLDPPLITNNATDVITDLTARVNGTINALGGLYNSQVEYGPTTSYGSTQAANGFSTYDPWPLVTSLTDLQPATLYHARIRLTDGVTSYVGEDFTFTTLPAATAPVIHEVNSWVSNNTATRAVLGLTVGFSGSSPATLAFEYGLTSSYGAEVVQPTPIPANQHWNSISAGQLTLTGLTPSTLYHYRARLSNAQGTTYSADMTFTTPPGVAVASLPASEVTDLGATLNGSVNTQGEHYTLFFDYGTTTAYGSVVNATGPYFSNSTAETLSVRLPRLQPDTTYHYRLRGVEWYDGSIVFLGGNQTFTTGPAATPPSFTGTVFAAGITATGAELRTSGCHSGSSDTTVVFQYGPTAAYGTTVTDDDIIPMNNAAGVLVPVSGLTPGMTYHFRCILTNAQGSVTSPDVTFTTLDVPVVTTEPATGVTDLSATLRGTAGAGAQLTAGFELGTTTAYGQVLTATPQSLVSAVPVAFSAVASLLPNTTYHYRTRVSFHGESSILYYGPDVTFTTGAAASPPVVTTTGAITALAPSFATVQGSAHAGSSEAALVWEYGTTTAYGSTVAASPATLAAGGSATVTGTLSGLQPATTYHYRLKGTNQEGTGLGLDATVTTLAGPTVTTGAASVIGDLSANVTGSVTTAGEALNIVFEYGTTTAYGLTKAYAPKLLSGTASPTVALTNLLPDTTYHYRMVAIGPAPGLVRYPGVDRSFTTGPPATKPTMNITVTSRQIDSLVLSATVTPGSSTATVLLEYGLTSAYGTQIAFSPAVEVGTGPRTFSETLTGLQPGTTYHYRWVASNSEGTTTSPDLLALTLPLPIVNTLAPGTLGVSSAELKGSSSMQGGSYSREFEYGPTTAYGSTVAPSFAISFPNDYATRSVTATATGLSPGTTYHYRLRLGGPNGAYYYGTDMTFTTPATPSDAWRLKNFASAANAGAAADDACPSGDGIPNLMKYALRMNPAATGTMPYAQVREYEGRTHLSLSFERDPANTDLRYEAQTADSLTGPWTTVTEIVGGGAPTGAGFVDEDLSYALVPVGSPPVLISATVEVRDPVSMADAPQRYMRLKVTRLP